MKLILAMLAFAASDHRVVFTHYETREPTVAMMEAYESGDKELLASLLPVTDRVELSVGDGETVRFAGSKLNGYASLEIDRMGYFLRFDSGSFEHKSPALLRRCQPHIFWHLRMKAGEKRKLAVQDVVVGNGC